LALRKSLEQKIVDLVELRNDTFQYPADEMPEFRFVDLTDQIKATVNDLGRLKVAITRANLDTKLPNGFSLYENILELGGVRAAIGQLKQLLKVGERYSYGRTRRTNVQEIKVAQQVPSENILTMVAKYEERRRIIDSMIQEANHTVEVPW
jgi:hypothetical protein